MAFQRTIVGTVLAPADFILVNGWRRAGMD
jgi:hypothetical protein